MHTLTHSPGLQQPPDVISIPAFSTSVSAQQVLPLWDTVGGRIPLELGNRYTTGVVTLSQTFYCPFFMLAQCFEEMNAALNCVDMCLSSSACAQREEGLFIKVIYFRLK